MTTLHLRKSIDLSPPRRSFLAGALGLAWLALSFPAQAQLPPPPPDGGYPNFNTAEGDNALLHLNVADGVANTALGNSALRDNIDGRFNTATGVSALQNGASGSNNTATGSGALRDNTADNNTATGAFALQSNTTGTNNVANGDLALLGSTTASNNTATGSGALQGNFIGSNNTANGAGALRNNNADGNTATGFQALRFNTTGTQNTAGGLNALAANTIGISNTATGARALFNNTTGARNIALGFNAGVNLTTGNSNIDIGNLGVGAESATIRIGVQGTQTRTFVAGISGSPITGTSVVVSSFGRLGTVASSQRFKDDIRSMDKASEAILALKPVTFHYKKEVDPDGIPQFGLVAEQVEKVNPDLVARDEEGKVYTVRYEAVNAMLLNEFLKEHRKVEEQEASITQLKSAVAQQEKDSQANAARQQKQIEALTAGLQKVSAQLEVNKPAPQIVLNNQ